MVPIRHLTFALSTIERRGPDRGRIELQDGCVTQRSIATWPFWQLIHRVTS